MHNKQYLNVISFQNGSILGQKNPDAKFITIVIASGLACSCLNICAFAATTMLPTASAASIVRAVTLVLLFVVGKFIFHEGVTVIHFMAGGLSLIGCFLIGFTVLVADNHVENVTRNFMDGVNNSNITLNDIDKICSKVVDVKNSPIIRVSSKNRTMDVTSETLSTRLEEANFIENKADYSNSEKQNQSLESNKTTDIQKSEIKMNGEGDEQHPANSGLKFQNDRTEMQVIYDSNNMNEKLSTNRTTTARNNCLHLSNKLEKAEKGTDRDNIMLGLILAVSAAMSLTFVRTFSKYLSNHGMKFTQLTFTNSLIQLFSALIITFSFESWAWPDDLENRIYLSGHAFFAGVDTLAIYACISYGEV